MVDYSLLKQEQINVIEHGKGNILVSASAGSGKTFVMIQRLIRLIKEGAADVDRILAVTFTEAAAKSMKDKLKSALKEEYAVSHDKRIEEQILLVDTADISTYHSFCKRLIQNYFYAADVSPDFTIADEKTADALKLTAINRVFDRFYEREDFFDLVERYATSRSDKGLKDIITYMYNKCITEGDFESLLQKTEASYSVNENDVYELFNDERLRDFKIELNYVKQILSSFETVNRETMPEKMAKNVADTMEYVDFLLSCNGVEEVKNRDKVIPTVRFSNLSAEDTLKNEDFKKIKANIRDIKKSYEEDNETKDNYLVSVKKMRTQTSILFDVLRAFKKEYENIKKEEGVLDFDDLMHIGLRVLKDDTVVKEVRQKYKYVFIDEYQDTNGIQEEIISRIASDNLFMVGDLKQSIYGFRNCSPEYFLEKYRNLKQFGGKVENLNYNFRSAQKILDIVNEIFLNCMTVKNCNIDYAEHTLKGGDIYPLTYSGRTKVYRIIRDKEEKIKKENRKEKPRIYDLLEEKDEEETPEDALLIAKIITEELGKKYYDIETKAEKEITYGDIAVLMRSVTSSKYAAIIKALYDMGFDIESDAEQEIAEYGEICVMKSALELVERFYRDIPLITVMKSPIGKFSLEELVKISEFDEKAGEKKRSFSSAFRYALENMEDALGDKIKRFYEYFKDLRFISHFSSAGEIMDKIAFDNDLEAYFYASGAGNAKTARLRRFIGAGKESGGYSVREFLRFVKNNPTAIKLNISSGKNAVKILTIHKSKGLEYPVVIVPCLEHAFNIEDTKKPVLYNRTYGFSEKIFNSEEKTSSETLLRKLIKNHIIRESAEEEMRIYYVALTRAKYSMHLIIDGETQEQKGKPFISFAQCLPHDINIERINAKDLEFIGRRAETRKILIGEENKTFTDVIRRNLSYTYPYERETSLPIKISVTQALKQEKSEQPVYFMDYDETEKTDTETGITAHKIMELADFYSGVSIEEQVKEFINKGYVYEEDVKKVNLNCLQKALNLNVIKNSEGKAIYKEQDFIVSVPSCLVFSDGNEREVLVQGIIDLLIVDEKNKTAEIVDYKYSLKNAENLKNSYKKQLDLYAYAVEKILSLKVVGKTIISLLSGESVKTD